MKPGEQTPVLDYGYLRLVDVMGSDLSVVNAARASYDKESSVMSNKDEGLINFLVKNYHDSPLRHATMTFEVYAPLMVARQWWKHIVASTHLDDSEGWNESSRRYVTETPKFYVPEWRGEAPHGKQGSSDSVSESIGEEATNALVEHYARSEKLYEHAMANGIASEQARLFLPAYGLYVRWRWTASLNAVLNFVSLRLGEGAQSEIVQYAEVVSEALEDNFPVTFEAWLAHRTGGSK